MTDGNICSAIAAFGEALSAFKVAPGRDWTEGSSGYGSHLHTSSGALAVHRQNESAEECDDRSALFSKAPVRRRPPRRRRARDRPTGLSATEPRSLLTPADSRMISVPPGLFLSPSPHLQHAHFGDCSGYLSGEEHRGDFIIRAAQPCVDMAEPHPNATALVVPLLSMQNDAVHEDLSGRKSGADVPLRSEPGGEQQSAAMADSDMPEGLSEEDVQKTMDQLKCSSSFAMTVFKEMNIAIVCEELGCDRSWALVLLKRHQFDPFLVRARETNYNALCLGHSDDQEFNLSELRTSWGTTVQLPNDDGNDLVFSVDGRFIRADPDYLDFEWIDAVPPLRRTDHADSVFGSDSLVKITCHGNESTAAASDYESCSIHSLSSRGSAGFDVGDVIMVHGLKGAPELNGCIGSILSFVSSSSRFEIKLEGIDGTKGVKAANLRLV